MRHPNSPSTQSNPKPDYDPDPARPTFGPGLVGLRKKGIGVRAWLVLDSMGQAQVVEAGKHAIMKRTGLPARDLRVLDPLLSYPSTVLGREKAIVINLEHIKSIITAQEVMLLNAKDPSVTPFVDELQRRLLRLRQVSENQEAGRDEDNVEWTDLYALRRPQSADVSPRNDPPSGGMYNEKDDMDEKQDWRNKDGVKVLPFEFIALEACLEAACSSLDNEARTLEQEAHPALDKLTSKISTLNLERVRQIKSRLVALTGRVQKVRDELEHLLDDDEDMAEMYLTEKLAQPNIEDSSISSMKEHDIDERVSNPPEILLDAHEGYRQYVEDEDGDHYYGANAVLARSVTQTSTTHSVITKHLDVEELEMLLEAYFVQIDGTLNKLTTLREYVDDTEDYINIMLDDKQNHLLQMGVMLTTATLVISAFIVVAGVFGMNIGISLFDPNKYGDREFLWTVGGGATGTLALYVMVVAWCKHKRLLE